MGARKPTTEINWDRVFELRCKSKRGERLTEAEFEIVKAAHTADPTRYGALNDRVFEATKPFGSTS